jgi:hypothetical protein
MRKRGTSSSAHTDRHRQDHATAACMQPSLSLSLLQASLCDSLSLSVSLLCTCLDALRVGDEEVVADNLRSHLGRQVRIRGPVVLVERILNRHHCAQFAPIIHPRQSHPRRQVGRPVRVSMASCSTITCLYTNPHTHSLSLTESTAAPTVIVIKQRLIERGELLAREPLAT